MSLELAFFNIWAILVCFAVNMLIGALWYSPILFGNQWLKLIGKKQEDISKEDASKSMTLSMIPALFSVLFLSIILAFVNTSSLFDAILMGSLVSVGFIGMSALNLVLFENRSIKLAILNTGYSFVSFNIAAIILTVWK